MGSFLILIGVIVLVLFCMRKGGMETGCCGGHSHSGHDEHLRDANREDATDKAK